MNIKRIISSIGIGAGAIIIGLGVQYALANWSPAPNAPPTCSDPTIPGCNAPINVGSASQAKLGGLSVGTTSPISVANLVKGQIADFEGGLFAQSILTQGLTLINGSQSAGKVLTSDANGNASWAPSAASSTATLVVTTSIPAATVMTVSNTKGAVPDFVRWLAVNDIADQGYQPGDQAEIINDQTYPNSAWNTPQGPWETSSQLGYTSDGQLFSNALEISAKGGTGAIYAKSSKWHVKVVALWLNYTGPSGTYTVTYGCTDPSAANPNANATQNATVANPGTGVCTYPPLDATAVTCTVTPTNAPVGSNLVYTLDGQISGAIPPYQYRVTNIPWHTGNVSITNGQYVTGTTFPGYYKSSSHTPTSTTVVITSSDSQTSSSISCTY
jgi:hypothetical protein